MSSSPSNRPKPSGCLPIYGNPGVVLLTNTHPIYPVGVIKGELEYPPVNELKEAVARVLPASYFIDATDLALSLGNPILANIVMLGALSRLAVIPFGKEDFLDAITQADGTSADRRKYAGLRGGVREDHGLRHIMPERCSQAESDLPDRARRFPPGISMTGPAMHPFSA